MIRHATHADIPALTQGMMALKDHTGWSAYHQPGYNHDTLTAFLTARLLHPQSVLFVWDPGTGVSAFCGGSLQWFTLPPYMPSVLEWGWFGPARPAAKCWNALCEWGRDHGAELAGRVSAVPGTHPKRIRESLTWKVL